MKPETNSLKGILVLIALLLAGNLAMTALRADSRPLPPVMPTAQAGDVLKLDGPTLITTNESGDKLIIWQLGRFVNDGYESVKARTYDAATSRH